MEDTPHHTMRLDKLGLVVTQKVIDNSAQERLVFCDRSGVVPSLPRNHRGKNEAACSSATPGTRTRRHPSCRQVPGCGSCGIPTD